MYSVLLTQYQGSILGPVAKILGLLMNGIFNVLDSIGIPNIGLCIIIFTIVIYALLTPLTYKQQKFSKLSQKMNPELQKIQAKYKGKKDQESMTKMNEETRAVYDKYGVSPSGSCVQLAIQMPILLALYRVIFAMPAYVTKIGDTFRVLADKIVTSDNGSFLSESGIDAIDKVVKQYGKSLTEGTDIQNGIVDVLNKVSSTDLQTISSHYNLGNLTFNNQKIISEIGANGETITRGLIDKFNYFLGLNIGDSPSATITAAIHNQNGIQFGLIIGAILIPVLAALTQWINTKLMPQPANNNSNSNSTQDTMASTMKSMNLMMPIMSAVFCYSLPAGMGLYWIAGAVIRSFQQIAINKIIDKEDIDAEIEKNMEKAKKKAEKAGVSTEVLNKNAKISTKTIAEVSGKSKAEKEEALKKAQEYYNKSAKPGSLASKANMVKMYNEKNNQN